MKDFDRVYKYYDSFMKALKLYKDEEILEALDLKGNETVLDIGGGTGYIASKISPKCNKVLVLDESKKMLSKVKKMDNIIPMVGDATAITLDSGSVDVVLLTDVVHHIENQDALIREINRVLRTHGKILILDFERSHWKTKVIRFFEYFIFGPLYFRTYPEVFDLLNRYFKVVKYIERGYYFIVVGEKVNG